MTIERAHATASDTLEATSDTLIDNMTLTPPSGEYLLTFTATLLTNSASTNDHNNIFSAYVGGSKVTGSEVRYEEDGSINDAFLPMIVSIEVNPNGSEAVEIRHRVTNATGPMFIQDRELNLFPMTGGLQDTDDVIDTFAGTTGVWALLDNMTETPAADDYLLVFSAAAQGPSGSTLGFRVSVGGTDITASEINQFQESSWAGRYFPFLLIAKISPDGSETVEIEWTRVGGTGTLECQSRSMNLIPIADADMFLATGTVDDTDGTTNDVLIDDMTITDPGADDYLVLFAAFDFTGSTSNNEFEVEYHVHEGGTHVADTIRKHEHEGSVDNTDIPVMMTGRVTVAGATDDIQEFWQNPASTLTRTMKNRQLIAVREAAAAPAVVILKPYNYQPYLAR